MKFSELLDAATFDGATMTTPIPESWAQGRTAYGGLTASFCASAVAKNHPDLPPMRSAQIAFIGPAAGEAVLTTKLLRQGKSTAFIDGELSVDGKVATRGTFVYGAKRESKISMADTPLPSLPSWQELETMEITPFHPGFLAQFEIRVANGELPFMGTGGHTVYWWVRHRDPSAWGTEIGLLSIGDVLPPAIAPMITGPAPVSSVNWHHDVLTDDPSTEDGWYLLLTHAQASGDGWSGQDMAIWASDGRPIAAGRQSIVVFA